VWTYTAYILNKFGEKNNYGELSVDDLSVFVFDNLWRKQKLSFYDNREDLVLDLKYLDKLKVIDLELEKRIRLREKKLKKISRIVEDSALLTGVTLFDEYRRRIDKAFECLQQKQ